MARKAMTPMSNVIPKERQTAYQRWELTSFGEARPSQTEKQDEVERISQAELDAIKTQARQEAYAEGYKEAYETGFMQGREAGYQEMQEQAQSLIAHLEGLTIEFKNEIKRSNESIGNELLQLALTIAERMTKRKIEVSPELITEIIQDAIELLPAVHQPAIIYLNPDDCELVKELSPSKFENQGWKLQSDPHLSRGGCRIETSQNTIDASIESRWRQLTNRILGLTMEQESV